MRTDRRKSIFHTLLQQTLCWSFCIVWDTLAESLQAGPAGALAFPSPLRGRAMSEDAVEFRFGSSSLIGSTAFPRKTLGEKMPQSDPGWCG